MKDTLGNLLVIIIGIGIIYLIVNGWKDKIINIDGHRYIEHPSMHSSDVEHSPSCWCKDK